MGEHSSLERSGMFLVMEKGGLTVTLKVTASLLDVWLTYLLERVPPSCAIRHNGEKDVAANWINNDE